MLLRRAGLSVTAGLSCFKCYVLYKSTFYLLTLRILAEEIAFKRPFSRISNLRDLDLGSCYAAYRRVSFIDFYLHAKLHSYREKNFVGKRTDVRTALLGLLLRVDLKIIQTVY